MGSSVICLHYRTSPFIFRDVPSDLWPVFKTYLREFVRYGDWANIDTHWLAYFRVSTKRKDEFTLMILFRRRGKRLHYLEHWYYWPEVGDE